MTPHVCFPLGGAAILLGSGTLQESLSMPPRTGLAAGRISSRFDGSVTCRTQFPGFFEYVGACLPHGLEIFAGC